ncbi:hypothetical protein HG536_0B01510 [Torulaspora globosa]|uniref:Bud site selection protein 5 n=1 Tax=Torulaspora globosa TaxID=48254 RepID=A0A7G3ZCQ3_9SACH|nr:uncharacterized protein HG536_0B01510 [Torulaspora globosa]QLL31289.1 hypothetical protein HG536_0B01510 [Torulaspora globosa]
MNSGISATTPLFLHNDDDFVSPTRSLQINFEHSEEGMLELPEQQYKSTAGHRKDHSSKSLSSVSDTSFQTAPSAHIEVRADAEDEEDLTLMSNNALTGFRGYQEELADNTPVIGRKSPTEEDVMTPRCIRDNNTEKSHESEGDRALLYKEPETGLGISKRESSITISSYIKTANSTKIVSPTSSPIRAIRASAIINNRAGRKLLDGGLQKGNPVSNDQSNSVSNSNTSLAPDLDKRPMGLSKAPTLKKSSEISLHDDSFAYLFIIAIHSFNAESLENPEDVSICLSFEKNDIAFVHTVDESGWGEVTLIRNRKRGWVPFNYFSDTVKPTESSRSDLSTYDLIKSRLPLQELLSACAKFLLHPQDTRLPGAKEATFNVEYINQIRDGVKTVLEMTGCVSRSNDLVKQKPDLRKARKLLLANWYNLMIKADFHKHSTNPANIQKLIDLTFEVLNRAFEFFNIWSTETTAAIQNPEQKAEDVQQATKSALVPSASDLQMPHLTKPPTAMARLHEIYDLLILYVGLILGRLDLIEHNPSGVEALEYIVHQVIVLLRELLYINKSCSAIIQEKFQYAYENTLHKNLDPLFSLVSELVSCVKALVTETLKEDFGHTARHLSIKEGTYHYTDQGQRLCDVVANMTGLISDSISGCSSYLRLIGDFQLSADRQNLDFQKIKMTPAKFFQRCSVGLTKHIDKGLLKEKFFEAESGRDPRSWKSVSRYSCIRSGSMDDPGITRRGTQFLQDYLQDQKPFGRDSTFEAFRPDELEQEKQDSKWDNINDKQLMLDELVFDNDGNIVAGSLRALVYKLTDEIDKPDDFFIATCLYNFRSFGTAIDFIDLLISRADLNDSTSQFDCSTSNGPYSSRSSRIKNRRKLVSFIFQTWMESFWDSSTDYKVLPTMINFFNEGLSLHLPIESKRLIEIAAKLSAWKPTSKAYKRGQKVHPQLKPKKIRSRCNSIYSDISSSSLSSRLSVFSLDEKIIEEYELNHVQPRSVSSISLPLPVLNLGTSSLLSKRNVQDMERLVNRYRSMVGKSIQTTTPNAFVPKSELSLLIMEWNDLVNRCKEVPRNLIHNDMSLVDLNALEVAKQLTLIESRLYLNIHSFELLDDKLLEKNLDEKSSPNVTTLLGFTNRLSNYVFETILSPQISLKARVSRLKVWLKVALSCSYFRNYNSVASIMTALQNHAITRLNTIWTDLRKKDIELYEYLSRIVHPNNNFKVYRKKLKRYMKEDAVGTLSQDRSSVPVVPFFNLFLQDLTFISEGNNTFRNPDSFRPHKLINLDKFYKITKTLNITAYFQVDYEVQEERTENLSSFFNLNDQVDGDTKSIKPIPLLQEFILYEIWRVNILYKETTDRAYQLSLQLSPRK